jgi:LacI family transcriptional regulator
MATMQDIADLAGVSICTVSKVLNRSKGWQLYSGQCVDRVRRAARELGYRRSYHASSLRSGRSQAIGMVLQAGMDASGDGFLSAMICRTDLGVRQAGYHLVLVGPSGMRSEVDNAVRYLQEGRIDGLIVPGFALSDDDLAQLEPLGDSVVLTHCWRETSLATVNLDEACGIGQAVEHLHQLGHRAVAWVAPATDDTSETRRREALMAACESRGLDYRTLLLPDPGSQAPTGPAAEMERAHRHIRDYLTDRPRVTALICYHDVIALGAYAAAQDLDLGIGIDLSVVGFDDVYAAMAYPPMTAVSHMLEQIARRAVSRLIDQIDGQHDGPQAGPEAVEAELVIRRSTGPPPSP